MELEISHLLDLDLTDFSASAMELGENAGQITWSNACDSGLIFVSTDEEKQAARDYIKDFGAWSDEEINSWSDIELNALILQFISGHLREYLDAKEGPDFDRWQENNGGNIFETEDGKLYYYLGI